MKREELQEILLKYLQEKGSMEFLWTVDDILFTPKIEKNEKYGFLSWGKVMALGDFRGNFDYGQGLMVIKIRSCPSQSWYRDEKQPMTYVIDMVILNIDDGIWRATSNEFTSLEKANGVVELLYQKFENLNIIEP